MILFPRRHRSFILKVLLFIPLFWMTVAFLFYSESKHKDDDIEVDSLFSPNNLIQSAVDIRALENDEKHSESEASHSSIASSLQSQANHPDHDHEFGVGPPPGDPVGPGEMGKPVKIDNPDPEIKKIIDKGWKDNAFNQYVSDMISVHRSLPDPRDEWCKVPNRFLTNLPTTSVIICFHNEAWSILQRTIHSVMDRSPTHLLKEIILVDDFSSMPHLGKQLDDYVEQYSLIKIVREPERVGLIKARLSGAKAATSQVLTFLDSHCECTVGWLEPLLDRIARDPTNVVCPVIDVIDDNTLEYHYRPSGDVSVGGFDWNLQFNWHTVPDREKLKHNHSSEAVASPTMAGGLFSIDRNFFQKLGTYDSGFDIWGGENLELSFKTWMCGGTLEIVPCSHVGHIFRKRSPYKWRTGVNVLRRNSIRLAEVWLDDYKQYYYERIGHDLGDFGDISERLKIRKDLNCKSFKWYLDTIYPELFVPGEALASGEIRNSWSEICIDSANKAEDLHKSVGLWPCHNQGGNQYWMFSKTGEIRRDESCLDYSGTDVILYPCHGSKGNQFWEYDHDERTLTHDSSKKCLALSPKKDKLVMESCNRNSERQRWKFSSFKDSSNNNNE